MLRFANYLDSTSFLFLFLFALVGISYGQQPTQLTNQVERVTVTQVQELLKQTNESTDLDEETKQRVVVSLEQALQALKGANEAATRLSTFTEMELSPSRQLEQIQTQLAAFDQTSRLPEVDSPEQLEQLVQIKLQLLDSEKKKLESLSGEPRRRADRRTEIPQVVVAAREELTKVIQQIESEADAANKDAVSEARRIRLLSRKQELQIKIPALEKELAAYIGTTKLLSAQTELASKTVSRLDAELAKMREELGRLQQVAAEEKIREAQRMRASEANPAVKLMLDDYAKLAEEIKQLNDQASDRQRQLDDLNKVVEKWNRRITRTEDRAKTGGRTQAIGLLLRRELAELPGPRKPFLGKTNMVPEIRAAQLRYFDLLDRQSDLNDEQFIAETVANVVYQSPEVATDEVEAAVKDILRMERNLLSPLLLSYESFLDNLNKYDEKQKELDGKLAYYREFINERILWIQSCTFAGLFDFQQIQKTSEVFLTLPSWQSLANKLLDDTLRNWPLYLLFLAAFLMMFRTQKNARRNLAEIGEQLKSNPRLPIKSTIDAVFQTLVASLAVPLMLVFASWRLRSLDAAPLGQHIGLGLLIVAMLVLGAEFLRQVCRPNGLAELHFQYPKDAVVYSRKFFQHLLVLIAPFVFLIWTIESWSGMTGSNPIGRYALFAVCLILIVAVHFYFRPGGIVVTSARENNPRGWWGKYAILVYALVLSIPAVLLIASLIGYHYTSLRLIQKFRPSFLLLFVLLLIGNILIRWLRLETTQAAQRTASEQRDSVAVSEASSANSMQSTASNSSLAGHESAQDSTQVDATISSQLLPVTADSRLIISALAATVCIFGFWVIWADVFPALRVLQQFELWESTTKVTREVTGAVEGTTRIETIEQLIPITLMDLGSAAIAFLIMVGLLRFVPILLEFTLLKRLPLDAGSRYALTTVVRWAITIIGLMIIAGFLGFTWSKIQWLAAAVTIGLGFGLQEIFANFVSGLILLAERPVRVGDVVTIGDVTGSVVRIQMRATTVRDWKKKELVVPNKELITGRLFNWTLSDDIYRLDFPVGVAYGSDTPLARQLMLDIARCHRYVVKDPQPKSVFLGFGDNALQLELRVFIHSMDQWLTVVSEINTAIDREFKRANIVIAYPQRDLHIRSIDGQLAVKQSMPTFAQNPENVEGDD